MIICIGFKLSLAIFPIEYYRDVINYITNHHLPVLCNLLAKSFMILGRVFRLEPVLRYLLKGYSKLIFSMNLFWKYHLLLINHHVKIPRKRLLFIDAIKKVFIRFKLSYYCQIIICRFLIRSTSDAFYVNMVKI